MDEKTQNIGGALLDEGTAVETDFSKYTMEQLQELAASYGITNDPMDKVQLSALVAIKIIKHCISTSPDPATGSLLGLDVGSTLEVTNSFPLPTKDADMDEDDSSSYQVDMMSLLRESNVDWYTVGWYTSTFLRSIPTSLIVGQHAYQSSISKCVVILYDPLKMSKGEIWLKAYRLTDSFQKLYGKSDFSQQSLIEVNQSYDNIFEEVPIEIKNSNLVDMFLAELNNKSRWQPSVQCDFDRLDLSINPFLEKNIEFLINSADELSQEQKQLQYYQRKRIQKKKEENQDKQPQDLNYLDSILLSGQINNYCAQIKDFTQESMQKLNILKGVHAT